MSEKPISRSALSVLLNTITVTASQAQSKEHDCGPKVKKGDRCKECMYAQGAKDTAKLIRDALLK